MELASRWAKFCEIVSHSVRYGMYAEYGDYTLQAGNNKDKTALMPKLICILFIVKIVLPHDKTNKMTAPSEDSDRPVWSECSLCAHWVAKDPSSFHADSEDSDRIGWMPRLIWVFAGRTCHFVGFVMRRLKCQKWLFHGGTLTKYPVFAGKSCIREWWLGMAGPLLGCVALWIYATTKTTCTQDRRFVKYREKL